MTAQEAKKNQDDIVKQGYKLSHWYGTWCEKCCGVYPKFETSGALQEKCYYICEVCGKRTENFDMPWLARDAWNNHEYKETCTQMSLF